MYGRATHILHSTTPRDWRRSLGVFKISQLILFKGIEHSFQCAVNYSMAFLPSLLAGPNMLPFLHECPVGRHKTRFDDDIPSNLKCSVDDVTLAVEVDQTCSRLPSGVDMFSIYAYRAYGRHVWL